MRASPKLLTGALFAVGFLLLGLLHGARVFETEYRASARMDRLLVAAPSRRPLPLAYRTEIAALPNVAAVTAQTLLGGEFGTPPTKLFIALTDETLFSFYNEIDVAAEDLAALRSTPNGLIVMRALADLREWNVGDTVTLHSQAMKADGSGDWDFRVVAIVDRKDVPNSDRAVFGNYSYVNDTRVDGKDCAFRFLVRVNDPGQSAETARAIDALFMSRTASTETMVEGIAVQEGTLGRAPIPVNMSVAAVAFVIFNLAATLATRSAAGSGTFLPGAARQLVIETTALAAAGAALGLIAAKAAIPPLKTLSSTNLYLAPYGWDDVIVGTGVAVLMAATAATLPLLRLRFEKRRR